MVTAQFLHLEHDCFRDFAGSSRMIPTATRESPKRSSADDRNGTRRSPAPAANPQNLGNQVRPAEAVLALLVASSAAPLSGSSAQGTTSPLTAQAGARSPYQEMLVVAPKQAVTA